MTENKQLLEDTKCEIRSILLTAPRGFDFQKFCQEYRGLIGQPLPWQKLGYNSAENFLQAIPDVVSMHWQPQIGSYVLRAVADESTKHIEKLVSKQKVSKSNKISVPKLRRGGYLSGMPNRRTFSPRVKPAQKAASTKSKVLQSTVPFVPAYIRSEIVQLLDSYPDGMRFAVLQEAYKKKFGKELNYEKMGFFTLHACLEQVSEVRCIQVNGDLHVYSESKRETAPQVGSNKGIGRRVTDIPPRFSNKAPVQPPSNPQPQTVPQNRSPLVERADVNSCGTHMSSPVKPVSSQQWAQGFHQGAASAEGQGQLASNVQSAPQHRSFANLTPQKDLTNVRSRVNEAGNSNTVLNQVPVSSVMQQSATPQLSPKPIDRSNSAPRQMPWQSATPQAEVPSRREELNDRMKENFVKILKNCPQGVWSREFPRKYAELTGHQLELPALGYYSLIELVDHHPDIFTRYKPSDCKSDWKLFLHGTQPLQSPVEVLTSPASNSKLSALDDVVVNIRKLLQFHHEGIFLDDFMHCYSLNFKTTLALSDFDCDDLETFLLSLSKSVPLKIKYSDVRKMVLFGYEPTLLQPRSSFMRGLYNEIPDDAIKPGSFYEVQTLPADLSDYIPIYIGTIANPSALWIQLKGEETSGALAKMMEALDCFYASPAGNLYMMEEKHITIGAVCAGIWSVDGSWHRISIEAAATGQNYIDAIFVDYGTKEKVLKKNLRFLKAEFFKLPAQAIKTRMAFIRPTSEMWDPRATARVLEIGKNKSLMAEIMYEPDYPGIPSVFICDTTGEDDLYLSELLIEEGYAVQDIPQEKTSPSAQNNLFSTQFHPNVHQSYSSQPQSFAGGIPQTFYRGANNLDPLTEMAIISQSKAASCLMQNEAFIEEAMQKLMLNNPTNGMSSVLSEIGRMFFACQDESSRSKLLTFASNLSSGFAAQNSPPKNFQPPGFKPVLSDAISTQNQSRQQYQTHPYPQYQAGAYSQHPAESFPHPQHEDIGKPVGHSSPPIEPPSRSKPSSDGAQMLDCSSSSDIFDDDEDEEEMFEEFCAERSTRRYVKRVKLEDGYQIHVIAVDEVAYVSCDEITHLFWQNESSDCLYRRLRSKNISITTTKITDTEHPQVFHQLVCSNVQGIKENDTEREIVLYPLTSVLDILNIFGHPSPTIRDEVDREIRLFNDCEGAWNQYFSAEKDEADEQDSYDTDSDKFQRLCSFDLRAILEGLRYRRLKLTKSSSDTDGNEELRKIESQQRVYERRLREIEAISKSHRSAQAN